MSGRPGFTLLEALVAVAVTSLLMSVGVQVARSLLERQQHARAGLGRQVAADVLLDRIESELLGTLLVVKPEQIDRLAFPWMFVSEDRVFGADDSDGLRFITLSPARLPGAAPTGPRVVTYQVDSGLGDTLDLYRQEERVPEGLEKEIRVDDGRVVVDDVARFSLRFRDDLGEWRDAWDSTDLAMLDRLPAVVELAVQLYERDEWGELLLGEERTRAVELVVRPLDPSGAAGAEQVCEDGPTVDECLAEHESELASLPPNARRLIESARSGAGPCWHALDPSPRHLKLFEYFEEFVSDPNGACR